MTSRWRTQDPQGWTIHDTTIAHVEKLISRAHETVSGRPAVVFDLDGTLFDVNYRSWGILDSWLEESVAQSFSDDVIQRLRGLEFRHLAYSVKEAFHNLGLDLSDPEVAAAYESAQREWKRRFFDGKSLLVYDKPLPGAVAFCEKLHARGFQLIYLSGRHRRVMAEGTRLQLERAGFPVGGCEIVLKEEHTLEDSIFKPRAFAEILAKWNVVANFENEYVNLGAMAAGHPDRLHVLVDSPHSDKPVQPLATTVYRIPNFEA